MSRPGGLLRLIAAAILIPGALYLLYLGWTNWRPLTNDLVRAIPDEHRAWRGPVRGFLADFRLVIEVLIVIGVASILDWVLRFFPSGEDAET